MARYVIVMYVTVDADDVKHAREISDAVVDIIEDSSAQVVGVNEDDPKLEEAE
jgi:hypothetical protein